MKRIRFWLPILLLALAACTSRPEASGAPPSGTWSGDYGPDSARREPVGLELRWEGTNLRGYVQAGPRSLPITKASFDAQTGAITLEFDTEGNRGQTVHYTIEGKLEGNGISGTWKHDDLTGDFKVTRE